jgi:hypothetical protein
VELGVRGQGAEGVRAQVGRSGVRSQGAEGVRARVLGCGVGVRARVLGVRLSSYCHLPNSCVLPRFNTDLVRVLPLIGDAFVCPIMQSLVV